MAAVEPFATGWTGTDLEAAPNGDLVFTDFGDGSPGTGSVKRVAYSPGNGSPTAKPPRSPSSGAAPLTVQFSSAGSTDPNGDPCPTVGLRRRRHKRERQPGPHLHGARRLDGEADRKRRPRPRPGGHRPGVGRRIGTHGDDPSPGDESLYCDGDTITLHGSASDPEDGDLPASRLSWNVLVHHGSHIHQVGTFDGVAQASFQTLRDHDADSYYEIILRATDSTGLTTTTRADIRPETVPFALMSTPSGVAMSYGGNATLSPFTTTAAVGFNTTVSAAGGFVAADGRPYVFDGWSDGGALTHNITVPASATTLTASYLENKAAARVATASSSEAGLDPRNAVDGSAGTRWSSVAADDQWWMVDLGAAPAGECRGDRLGGGLRLQLRDPHLARRRELLSGATGRPARPRCPPGHVRRAERALRARASSSASHGSGVSFWEARVLGPSDGAPPPPSPDLALNQPVSASSNPPVRRAARGGERRRLRNPLVVELRRRAVVAGRSRRRQERRPRGGQLGSRVRVGVPDPDLHRRHGVQRCRERLAQRARPRGNDLQRARCALHPARRGRTRHPVRAVVLGFPRIRPGHPTSSGHAGARDLHRLGPVRHHVGHRREPQVQLG